MTNARFREIQDKVLKLSGKEFAALLQVDPASISKWRTENREIPSYIASLVQFRALEAEGNLQIPISLTDLIGLSRAAEKRGITVEALLLDLIRGIIDVPVLAPKQKDYKPEILDTPSSDIIPLKAATAPISYLDSPEDHPPAKVASTIAHYSVAPPAVPPTPEN